MIGEWRQSTSKPIRSSELERLISGAPSLESDDDAEEDDQMGDGNLWDRLLELAGGDAEVVNEMVKLFVEESPKLMEAVRRALAGADARDLERAAHSLKGASAMYQPSPLAEAAFRLETMARERKVSEASRIWPELENAMAELLETIQSMGPRSENQNTG